MAKQGLLEGKPNKALDASVSRWLKNNLAGLVAVYKDLHAHPELSCNEKRTGGITAAKFRESGLKVTEGVGGYGVVGVLKNGAGPVVLIRADMDALPVEELTGLPYASRTPGVMHACGHDIHTSALTGMAAAFTEAKAKWRGTVVFVAQPAEERAQGAQAMVDDGLFDLFRKPDVCLALHVEAQMPVGEIGYRPGWATANVDSVDVTIFGKGGHGAYPHEAVDPIVAAAQFIGALQTISTRRIDPLDPVVITVGSIHAGRKHNIIPEKADMQITVRTYSDEVRAEVLSSIKSVAKATAKAAGCTKAPRVKTDVEHTASVYNDPALAEHAVTVFEPFVGKKNLVVRPAVMGGEDFSVFPRALGVPGLMYEIGATKPAVIKAAEKRGEPAPALHNGRFAPEGKPTLDMAVRSMCMLAGSILGKP